MDGEQGSTVALLLCSLSYATSLGGSTSAEHGLRTAYIGLRLAEALELPDSDREAVFYGALIKDVGCTACSAAFSVFFPDGDLVPRLDTMLVDHSNIGEMVAWLGRSVPMDSQFPTRVTRLMSLVTHCGTVLHDLARGHCEVAELFARRLGFGEHVQQALRYQLEYWDGSGLPFGLSGMQAPAAAQILHLAQIAALTDEIAGRDATVALVKERCGRRFAPDAVAAFLGLAADADFWSDQEAAGVQDRVLAMRPPTETERTGDMVEPVCQALADFADLKTRTAPGHSHQVADVAGSISSAMGQDRAFTEQVRRAGLVHDVGKVGVPSGILAKREERLPLSDSEIEQLHLHPYYTQRILERVMPLRALASGASSHHEWVNGAGYHRRLEGEHIPPDGRVLALANAFVHCRQRNGPDADPWQVERELRSRVGTEFDPACFQALSRWIQMGDRAQDVRPVRDAHGLTDREVEVLVLLSRGLNNREIAGELVISRKTVEHHLEHVYNKLGISSRTAAVAYAVSHRLAG